MRKQILISLLICLVALTIESNSQERAAIKEEVAGTYNGLFFNYNLNNYTSDFQNMPDFISSGALNATGKNSGFSIGVIYDIPFSRDFYLMLRGLYNNDHSELTAKSKDGLLFSNENSNYLFEHKINSNLSGIRFEPLFHLRLFAGLNIFAGGYVGISFKKSTEHSEKIVSGSSYQDSLNLIGSNHWSNESIGLQGGITGGIGYDFSLDSRKIIILGTEILYSQGFSKIIDKLSYNLTSLRFGLSLRYFPKTVKKKSETGLPKPPDIDPPMPEKPVNQVITFANNQPVINQKTNSRDTLELTAKAVKDGKIVNDVSISIEEYFSSDLHPLLNYVFFAEGSSDIPNRYNLLKKSESDQFRISSLYGLDAIKNYHNILNIIGYRLKNNKKAKLTVIGYNSGTAIETINISKARANSVANYLHNIWNVDLNRIKINSANLPENFSKGTDIESSSENRRVEIHSDDPTILATVESFDTVRKVDHQFIRFYPRLVTQSNIDGYSLSMRDNPLTTPKAVFSMKNMSISNEIDFDLKQNLTEIVSMGVSPIFEFNVNLNDTNIQISKTITSNPVVIHFKFSKYQESKKNFQESIIDKYSLILYDFDESKINEENKRILKYLSSKIKKNSTVEIDGFTDILGDESYNEKLSESRAKNAGKLLKSLLNFDVPILSRGNGESNSFDNTLPEGRFYNRTVKITVTTPNKK